MMEAGKPQVKENGGNRAIVLRNIDDWKAKMVLMIKIDLHYS